MNEFASKFEKDFLMVSCLFTNMVPRNARYVENGASRHMTSTQELFSNLKGNVLRVQVKLGDDVNYSVAGIGTISYQL